LAQSKRQVGPDEKSNHKEIADVSSKSKKEQQILHQRFALWLGVAG
jgi:hypothetical protein